MPTARQTEITEIVGILERILDISEPPVGRCRLLSSGFGHSHTLKTEAELTGSRACLGCGNCVDICSLLAREPARLRKTAQRTSLALETVVGTDCDRCYACVMSCPQVDTTIKHYIVKTRTIEQLRHLLAHLSPTDDSYLDQLLEEASAG
uniref:4Fe-4S ferredoxin-type domain-containing protein n=1 Tax=candidate division WOR-3 bacterium TaxID=2052148 RepID=A0A7C4GJG5_UNCW3